MKIFYNKKKAFLAGMAFCICSAVSVMSAEEYIVLSKNAKVFDTPNVKGYVTLNTHNEEVIAPPGMVFKSIEEKGGWHLVEYSPGLKGYISKMRIADEIKTPKPGIYKISNQPDKKLTVEKNGKIWKASAGEKTFNGEDHEGIIVFFDQNHNPTYSLADFGDGPIVMSYDNAITHFF